MSASKSVVHDLPEFSPAGVAMEFRILTFDRHQNPAEVSPGDIEITLDDEMTLIDKPRLRALGGGITKGELTCSKTGAVAVSVLVGGRSILGSPFTVNILPGEETGGWGFSGLEFFLLSFL